jgi:phosphate transport system substrate-binding protein
MKKLSTVVLATALLGSALFAESAESKKGANELKMYSCGVTRVAFMKELNEAFGKKFKVKIQMNEKGGDLFVLDGVHKKEADIGSGCRDTLKDIKNEKDLWSTQVAWGALSFIVHPKNKIDDISMDNIKKILTGKIKNWKELGGADKPIHLIIRESPNSGIGRVAREALFKDPKTVFDKEAKKVKSSGFVRKAVGEDENSFAVDNIISSSKDKQIKILKVGGIEATKENILSDKYKLRQALYFYLNDKPKDLAKKYVNFVLSEEGQAIISKTGTANLEEATGEGDEENLIFQDLQFDVKTK